MKSFIILAMILVSTSTFAAAVAVTTVASLGVTTTFQDDIPKMEAKQVLNDAQEAFQSGKISALLGQKLNNILAGNAELSEDEALEVVIKNAEKALN